MLCPKIILIYTDKFMILGLKPNMRYENLTYYFGLFKILQ